MPTIETQDDDIPDVDPITVEAITEMLIEEQGILRPPVKAAHLLAIICKLHEQNRPFPKRGDVAQKIDAGVSTVDAALSTRLDEGYISVRVQTREGNVERRKSVVRDRFYDPSPKLMGVFKHSEDRAQQSRRGMQKTQRAG